MKRRGDLIAELDELARKRDILLARQENLPKALMESLFVLILKRRDFIKKPAKLLKLLQQFSEMEKFVKNFKRM